MANLARVRVGWSGSPVTGEGVSTFYFAEAHTGFSADLVAWFTQLAVVVPTVVTFTVPSAGDLIDVATGELSGTWSGEAGGTVNSSSAQAYAAGVGMRVQWLTSGIRNGRRVKGSTFVVPITSNLYALDGSIADATIAAQTTGLNAFLTASLPNMVIYSRPSDTAAGQANTVIDGDIVDRVSWLRSRRT